MDGYSSTGDSGSFWGNLVGGVASAWSATEIAKSNAEASQAKQYGTPYQYNNPQAMAAPKDNTLTYIALGAVALVAVVGVAIALK